MRTQARCAVSILLAWAPTLSWSGVEPSLAVKGAVPAARSFQQKDLEALGAVDQTWMEHGTSHQVRGVPLGKLLAAVGFTPGPMGKDVPKREKRSGWKQVLRVTGSDGFQAVFSCAELWEEMGATRALLVWQVDGKPLAPDAGPFRISVLTDKEPSRSVHNVTTLEVIDLRS
jgi:hypothetical protein